MNSYAGRRIRQIQFESQMLPIHHNSFIPSHIPLLEVNTIDLESDDDMDMDMDLDEPLMLPVNHGIAFMGGTRPDGNASPPMPMS